MPFCVLKSRARWDSIRLSAPRQSPALETSSRLSVATCGSRSPRRHSFGRSLNRGPPSRPPTSSPSRSTRSSRLRSTLRPRWYVAGALVVQTPAQAKLTLQARWAIALIAVGLVYNKYNTDSEHDASPMDWLSQPEIVYLRRRLPDITERILRHFDCEGQWGWGGLSTDLNIVQFLYHCQLMFVERPGCVARNLRVDPIDVPARSRACRTPPRSPCSSPSPDP